MGRVGIELTTLGLKVQLNKLKATEADSKMLQSGQLSGAAN
jgi:hypothetical protein